MPVFPKESGIPAATEDLLTLPRQIGTLVLDAARTLWVSTNSTTATYATVGGGPGSTGSRTLNVQTASSAALNAGTGAGAQNFSDTYTIPAATLATGDTLHITVAGTTTRVAGFDLDIGIVLQAVNRGTYQRAAIGSSSTWMLDMTLTQMTATAARMVTKIFIGDGTTVIDLGVLYDDQGYTAAATGVVQVQATMSGGNAGNIVVQTMRSVEIIKASF